MFSDAIGFAREVHGRRPIVTRTWRGRITDTPMPRLLGGPVSSHALKEIGINESDRFFPVDVINGEADELFGAAI